MFSMIINKNILTYPPSKPNQPLWNTCVRDFSESPTYGEKILAADIEKKVAPAIDAIALTKVVLPQPERKIDIFKKNS